MADVVTLAPGLVRLRAPNPSPMTHTGTNTYLLGEGDVAVIDPGPAMPDHLDAILAALGGRPVRAILVTHAHLDHAPLARPLAEATGAPVMAFGDARAGRSARMAALSGIGGGEGVDTGFRPDEVLADGGTVAGADWTLSALHTPGHFGNHLSLAWGDAVFSGDLVMGWASTLVSPPDGDVADFRASCARLRACGPAVLHPGHGAPVTDPAARIDWLVGHRRAREDQIRAALTERPGTAVDLTARLYTDTPRALWPAASRNVLAHLVDLSDRGLARPLGPLTEHAVFAPT